MARRLLDEPWETTMLPKVILVPTDFGEPSEAALDQAIEYARAFGAEVVLMHAYQIPVVGFPDGAIVATAELTNSILEGARVALERQVASHEGAGVTIRSVIEQGDPATKVNETADAVGAGLICMGTHGRRGLPRLLLGSVAEKVVRMARVPVLTVHPEDLSKREAQVPASTAENAVSPPSHR